MIAKLTLGFLCNGYGWTESWFKNYTDGTPLNVIANGDGSAMADKRQAMLAPESSIVSVFISDQSVNGDSILRYQNRPGTCAGNCDLPHTAIYTLARSGADTQRKAIFFRGQPDDVTMFGGKFEPAPPAAPPSLGIAQFIAAGTVYMNFLQQNNFGWMRNNVTQTGVATNATAVVVGGVSKVQLTVNAGFLPAFVAGAKPAFFRCRLLFKKTKTVLNGVKVWEQTADDTLVSVDPIAFFALGDAKATITRYTPTLTTFATGDWNFQKSGRRPAGRPLYLTPGHAKARPLG